jgi:Reverse transcriptase (RNA-dependent DNA polymerase)
MLKIQETRLPGDCQLLDVEKAFESVWHEALLHKLLQRGCDICLAKLILSFLKDRSCLPQGAILSSTLYNIFTSDVPSFEFCNTTTCADGTAIFASGPTPLLVLGRTPFLIIAKIGKKNQRL